MLEGTVLELLNNLRSRVSPVLRWSASRKVGEKTVVTTAPIILTSLLFLSAGHAQSVDPGVWQADSTFEITGMELPPSRQSECISASEAKDIKKAILNELKIQGCTATKWQVTGKKLFVSLNCEKSGFEASGNLRGTFSSKSYDLSGQADGTFQGIPAEATISLKGKWLKPCKK